MLLNVTNPEPHLKQVKFDVHKFSKRQKPTDIEQIRIFSCFSEFGSEVVSCMYCIPRLKEESPNSYFIAIGWYGRDFLYKHLVDEFWEINEECQWLRKHALAFHHNSKNLFRLEKAVSKFGKLINANSIGGVAVKNQCKRCKHIWAQIKKVDFCIKCDSHYIDKALFADTRYWKQHFVPIPSPSKEKLLQAESYITNERSVGIIARNRSTYGRNLQPEFYTKLIYLLQKLDYTPVWIGEKETTLRCPVKDVLDFTTKEECRDLELTLAIVSKLSFTIQFWTASTRLAAMANTPFLLFESPDQLFGDNGQEAYRLSLCTFQKPKIVLSNFLNMYNDHNNSIKLVEESIREMEKNDWLVKIGMVDEETWVQHIVEKNLERLVI